MVVNLKLKRVKELLSKNVSLKRSNPPGYTPEKLMVRLFKRAIYPVVYSKTRVYASPKDRARVKLKRRSRTSVKRKLLTKLVRSLNINPYTKYGRTSLNAYFTRESEAKSMKPMFDNIYSVSSLPTVFQTTLGPGQHLKKNMSPSVLKPEGVLDNTRFYYDFSEALPGLHPLPRVMGLFTKKGYKQRAFKLFKQTLGRFKALIRPSINVARYLGKGQFRAAHSQAMHSIPYALHAALYNARPVFRMTSFKVAATKKKIPALNTISKSYSLYFSGLRASLKAFANSKKSTLPQPSRPFTKSSSYPIHVAHYLASGFLNGLGSKQQIANIKEAHENLPNLKSSRGFKKFKPSRR